jgi:hypothetical protein
MAGLPERALKAALPGIGNPAFFFKKKEGVKVPIRTANGYSI